MHYPDLDTYYQWEQDRISLLKNSNISTHLTIDSLFNTWDKTKWLWYSVTEQVDSLLIDQYWILWDRHRYTSWFRTSTPREDNIYILSEVKLLQNVIC